jgi:hypothetical protein
MTLSELIVEMERLCRFHNQNVVYFRPSDVARILAELRRVQADNEHLRREKAVAWGKINDE